MFFIRTHDLRFDNDDDNTFLLFVVCNPLAMSSTENIAPMCAHRSRYTYVVRRVRPNHFIAQNNDTEWRHVDIDFANGFAISERCMQTKCIWSVFDCRHNSISHPKKGEIWAISESEWCASAGKSSSLLLLLSLLLVQFWLYIYSQTHTHAIRIWIFTLRQDKIISRAICKNLFLTCHPPLLHIIINSTCTSIHTGGTNLCRLVV